MTRRTWAKAWTCDGASAWATLAISAILVCLDAAAAPDTFGLGDGHTGNVTLTASGQVNRYVALRAPTATGDTSLSVANTTGYLAGDLVMILQTTGIVPSLDSGDGTGGPVSIATNPVGTFELARLASVTGVVNGTLNLTSPLVHNFASVVTQVIRVPEYGNLTINAGVTVSALPWNGSTGGVLVFLATGTVINNGTISVANQGFRGGVFVNGPTNNLCAGLDEAPNDGAQKGEGIQVDRYGLSGTRFTGYGVVSNGAGGGVCHNSGGGGGGNGGLGGNGGYPWAGEVGGGEGRDLGGRGGRPLVYSQFDHMTLGGGGGSGHGNDNVATSGAAGGGAIFIRAGSFSGSGTLNANGQTAANTPGGPASGNDAAGGGGAGGSISLRVANSLQCAAVYAVGGSGGSVTYFCATCTTEHGPGGGGGGGRILLQASNIQANPGACPANVSSGVAGTTSRNTGERINYGATPNASGGSYVGVSTIASGGGFVPSIPPPAITAPADGSFINNNRPSISGTESLAAAQVVVSLDGRVICTATVTAGNWSCAVPRALADGTHSVSAVAIYQGTQSAPTNASFTVLTVPPPAPVITSPANNSFTNNNQPTIAGTAQPFATVTVRDDSGNIVCSAVASGTGAWSCAPASPLADGTYRLTARATDRAGNTGPASPPVTFTVKTVAPPAPVITSPAGNASTNNAQPTIAGTAEPFTTVTVTDSNGNVLCSAAASSSGVWSCTPASPLPEGTYTIRAGAVDRANNPSPMSDPVVFTVTMRPPPPPIISSPSNGSRTADNPPVVTGTSEPGSTVNASVDGVPICTVVADPSGNWSCPSGTSLSLGPHTTTATATNVNGSSGPTSADFTVFEHVLSYKGGGFGCSATGGTSLGFGALALIALFFLRRLEQ